MKKNKHYLNKKIMDKDLKTKNMELNKIYNEDCLIGLNKIPDNSIDLIITDPPYWHKKSPGKPYSERKKYNTKSNFSKSKLYNNDNDMMKKMSDFNDKDIFSFLSISLKKMKIPNIYVFCSENQVPYYCLFAEENNLMFSILAWEKPLSIINKNRFSQNIEYIVRIYDYGTALNRIGENKFYNRVKKYNNINGKIKHHPCEKPISLINEFIQLSSNKNDIILDPFMGSGTTAIAAIKAERNYIGFEISPKYYKIAQERINIEKSMPTLF